MDQDRSLVARAAMLLMIVQALSRVLGYARDAVLLNTFGQNYYTDAYNAAFSIPDFLYNVLIGGAIATAFIPVFSSYLAKGEEERAWRASSAFTTWVMLLLAIGCLATLIFTEQLLSVLTQFTHAQMALPVALTRITLIQSLFMAISAIATGILQSHKHFFWPAMGMLLYNICILLGGVLLVKPIEALFPGYGVAAFSVGVVIGAILTFVVQIPMLKKVGFRYTLLLDTRDPGLRQMIRLLVPVLIGLSVSQINLFVTQYLGTGLPEGSYTALRTANRFMQLPLGIFATSICTAMFPTMAHQVALNDYSGMKQSLSSGLRTILFIILPASVGLTMLREPIIRLLFEFSGKFTAADTQICSEALLFYNIGLFGYAGGMAVLRGFYAIQNTVTPLAVSAGAIVISIVFSFLLVGPMAHQGLALAYSLSGICQLLLLYYFLHRKIGRINTRRTLGTVLRTLLASALMAVAVWGVEVLTVALTVNKIGQALQVALGVIAGVGVFFLAARAMKMEELQTVMNIFAKRLRRRKK